MQLCPRGWGWRREEEEERLERERKRMKWEDLRWDLRRSREAMERMVMGREEEGMERDWKRLDEERRIMEREDRWGELEEMERRIMRKVQNPAMSTCIRSTQRRRR